MFWFAWTGEYNSVPWIVPTIAGVFLATSILLIFVAYLNYLTDTYLMYAASALAANTVARSGAGAAAPLFTQYMFDALGVGGGGSLIAGVACLLAPIPFIFYKYGGPIRERSKFAPTHKKPADEEKNIPIEQDTTLGEGGNVHDPMRRTYSNEGEGLDRVVSAGDRRESDAGQLDEHTVYETYSSSSAEAEKEDTTFEPVKAGR